jgi:vancomycin resistance protein YoaR
VRGRLVAGAVLGVLLAGFGGLTAARAGEALPGAAVEGTEVAGLDRAQVRTAVERLAAPRTRGELTVVAQEVRTTLPRELVDVDVDATVDEVMDDGESPFTALLRRGEDVALRTSVDPDGLDQRLGQLADQVDREPFAGSIAVQGLTVTAQPPVAGRTLDAQAGADRVVQALEDGSTAPVELPVTDVPATSTPAQVEAVAAAARTALAGPYVLGTAPVSLTVTPADVAPLLSMAQADGVPVLTLDTAALRALVAARAEPLTTRPRSAGFSVAGAPAQVTTQGDLAWTPRPAQVAVRPGSAGREVDVDAATARLRILVLTADRSAPQPLDVRTVEPPLTTAQASAAGVRTLLGTFTTSFQPGRPRATNIRRIAELVDGAYVPSGEVFSLNRRAGQRTAARGFVADGAIVDGVLTDEVGGGVSQFATTLFNAAFFAGLPILEHKPHSFYISRYPAGRESTVYYGAIDVKVRNDTGAGLLVRTRSTAGSVTVDLYGDNGGRRVVSTSGPRRPRADGGFSIDVTRTITGGDGRGERRVFRTSYDPVPPDER